MKSAMSDEYKLNLFLSRVLGAISANMSYVSFKRFRIKGATVAIGDTVKNLITKVTGTTPPEHVAIGYIQAKRKRWYVVNGLDHQSAVAVVTELKKLYRTSCKLYNVICVRDSDLDTAQCSTARIRVCFDVMNVIYEQEKLPFESVKFVPKSMGSNHTISIPIDKFVPVINDKHYFIFVGYPLNVRWMTTFELEQCLVEVTKKEYTRMKSIYKEYRQKNPSGLSPTEERYLIGGKVKLV